MKCTDGAILLIDQIIDTIGVIKDDEYDRSLDVYNGSTMGKHFRHIFDFFNCLLIQKDNETVDYCLRKRDDQLETNRLYAIERFNLLKQNIQGLDESQPLVVHADFEISEGVRPKVHTTVGREVMYAYDHAVHHLAIVKIGIKTINPDADINKNMGVAASTIRHQHALNHAG